MLIFLAILTLLLTPLVMALTRLYRPRFGYQWILAVLGALIVWPMVLVSRLNLPQRVALIHWRPEAFFPISPELLIDEISWPFAMALATVPLALLLTSVARLGQAPSPATPDSQPLAADWRAWSATLALTGLGLVAVTAGNPLTLLLSWAALDIVELLILLGQQRQSAVRERVVIAFSARVAGIAVLLLAGIVAWSSGSNLAFVEIPSQSSLYLLLASGLRLGVLPLYLPMQHELIARRGLGTALRLVSWAASLVLLARTASVMEVGSLTIYWLALSALAAIFGASGWLTAPDELAGRPFWALGTASLAVAAALLFQPGACLAWGLVSLLPGGLIFTLWPRHRNLLPFALLGLLGLTALPFTPAWNGTGIYLFSAGLVQISGKPEPLFRALLPLISLLYLIAHAMLIAGYLRHALAGSSENPAPIERWVWLVYPTGLALFALTHLGIGWTSLPQFEALPWPAWISGIAATLLGLLIWRLSLRLRRPAAATSPMQTPSTWVRLLSLNWLYRSFWHAYRLLSRLVSLVSAILEGEGGILWTLVILALLLTFLQP
jgi:hypothetical protein